MNESEHYANVTVVTVAGDFHSDPEPEVEFEKAASKFLEAAVAAGGYVKILEDGAPTVIPSRNIVAVRVNWAPGRAEREATS